MDSFRLLLVVCALFLAPGGAALAQQPILIAEGSAPQQPQQPQLALDEKGGLHLTYGARNDTYYVGSPDGVAFGKPVKLPSAQVMSLGMRRGPRIAAARGSICVTVVGGKQGKGRDGDVLAYHSADRGKTWSRPVVVNDVPDAAREGLHGMAAGPRGEFVCLWLDLRNERTEVMSATSTDGGQTWSKNLLVYRSPGGSVCECCHPSVTIDAQGRVIALWRNALEGNRDMYYAVAPRAGEPFGQAQKLGTGAWRLDRCPMDGGALTVTKDGSLATVWRREESLFTAPTAQAETLLGQGEQPVISATSGGLVVAWLAKRGGDLLVKRDGAAPKKVAGGAYDPALVSDVRSDKAYLAWESREGALARIYCLPLR